MLDKNGTPKAGSEHQRNVICFSSHDWWYHNRAHSDLQLMTRIARERKVLLINSIGMRMPMPGKSTMPLRRILRKALSMLRYVRRPLPSTPGFIVMTPIMVPLYGVPLLRRLNFLFIRLQIQLVARLMGIQCPHVFITVPTGIEVARHMERSCLVYNRSDIHSAFDEVDKDYIVPLENELLAGADAVFYSSHSLMEKEAAQSGDRAYFLDHGLDIEHFKRVVGESLPRLTLHGAVIGFFGGLDDYIVDFDLIELLAQRFPDATILLIGDATLSLERLERYPNIVLTGAKPYAEIPAYGSLFDVAIMPWLQNEWIRYCNPIKMKEYLALDLEIVTTYFPEAEFYREHMYIAESHEQFIAMVHDILDHSARKVDSKARRLLLQHASWDDRSCECLAHLDKVSEALCAE
ncbi:MAG: hypothetical protein JNK74_04605 [Candidatus Hydrogenedentes bacterium]|nr:hypothetical protein [Candidatus Hydrogenedentota bacterium]